jgi:hypothetical protein
MSRLYTVSCYFAGFSLGCLFMWAVVTYWLV